MEKGKAAVAVTKEEEEDKKRYQKALEIINATEATPEVCEEAIDLLTQVLEYRCGKYGELSAECAPAFYNYGLALFSKAKLENDVFGAPVQKAMVEKAIKQLKEDEQKEQGGGKENEEADENVEEVEGEEDDVEEEENDMELAWRNLETARLIYAKEEGHEREVADVYTALAELSMEREDFETSISDFKSALKTLEGVSGAERNLAEIHYKLCLALQLSAKDPSSKAGIMREAAEEVQKAISVLRKTDAKPGELEGILEELEEKRTELLQSTNPVMGGAGGSSSQLGFDKPKLSSKTVVMQAPVKRQKL
ncbi:SHNi-TPR domain-containing protein [Chloropicon primus]|nr:SHNi-TPR domain-containing protein [Chloropicon primus]